MLDTSPLAPLVHRSVLPAPVADSYHSRSGT